MREVEREYRRRREHSRFAIMKDSPTERQRQSFEVVENHHRRPSDIKFMECPLGYFFFSARAWGGSKERLRFSATVSARFAVLIKIRGDIRLCAVAFRAQAIMMQ